MTKKISKTDPFADREAAKYDRPIPSREYILTHLKTRKTPANYQELTEELKLETSDDQIALQRRIKAMLRDGQLEKMRGGYLWPSGHRILVKGRIHIEKGKKSQTWVIPEDGGPRILLLQPEGHAVYHGNLVIISIIDISMGPEHIREGHLVEIVEQQRMVVTGRFVQEANISYVIPHGKEYNQDVLVPAGRESIARNGDIVVVEITFQPLHMAKEPFGQIIEVLGHEDAPGVEIKAASRAYGLPEEWPIAVNQEIKDLSEVVQQAAKRGRLDIRELPLVTIDGEDAKDFDDAVYCEKKPGGGWRLYVAIADVSHYVLPNTALESEAKLRGNSVYFPGKVIPMLPEILSNGLCSLKPDVDRLCLVCILTINKAGSITRYEFHEGLMRSHARLTYTKVAAILEGKSDHLMQQYKELLPQLHELKSLYETLRAEREERGAIEFETLETRIIFGKDGKISRIEPITRNDAHRIIEECMLCANVATARFLKKNKMPGLYRIHQGPPPDKLEDLKIFLQELGLSLGGGKEPLPLDYAKLLRSIQNRPDANVIQSVLLRSLSQAVYSPDNVGHFGLAYPEYSHFTSPIRRYPDLLVHRQIRSVLRGKWTEKEIELSKKDEAKKALLELGDHTSMTERRADEATRDAVRWLKCQYIEKHIGETFQGIISGVTRFGFFVELKEIYIDGLVHVTSLHDDYYYFDAVHHRLIGERSGLIYKLGDTVTVIVSRVDINERKIDFDLVGKPKRGATKKFQKSSSKGNDSARSGLEGSKKQKGDAKRKRGNENKSKRANSRTGSEEKQDFKQKSKKNRVKDLKREEAPSKNSSRKPSNNASKIHLKKDSKNESKNDSKRDPSKKPMDPEKLRKLREKKKAKRARRRQRERKTADE